MSDRAIRTAIIAYAVVEAIGIAAILWSSMR